MAIAIGLRAMLGALFLYSGMIKFNRPYEFLGNVYSYQLVGPFVGEVVAAMLPVLEVSLGICLLGGALVAGALTCSVLLSCVFLMAQSHAIASGLAVDCGCFGTSSQVISYSSFLRVTAVGAASLFALFQYGAMPANDPALGIPSATHRLNGVVSHLKGSLH